MRARIIYEVESPEDVYCNREDFLKWLEFNLGIPGACVTSDNPLYEEHIDFDCSEYNKIEVIDG